MYSKYERIIMKIFKKLFDKYRKEIVNTLI